MSRLTLPPGMPEGVSEIIDLLGNRARAQIMRELIHHGPLTGPELAEKVGTRREVVHLHLAKLEAGGLVLADLPAGDRAGRTVQWSANADETRRLMREWTAYVLGQ